MLCCWMRACVRCSTPGGCWREREKGETCGRGEGAARAERELRVAVDPAQRLAAPLLAYAAHFHCLHARPHARHTTHQPAGRAATPARDVFAAHGHAGAHGALGRAWTRHARWNAAWTENGTRQGPAGREAGAGRTTTSPPLLLTSRELTSFPPVLPPPYDPLVRPFVDDRARTDHHPSLPRLGSTRPPSQNHGRASREVLPEAAALPQHEGGHDLAQGCWKGPQVVQGRRSRLQGQSTLVLVCVASRVN